MTSDDQTTVESGSDGGDRSSGSGHGQRPGTGTLTREAPRKRAARRATSATEERLVYEPGQHFGERYTIVDCIGHGGMGVVYKARDLELNRTVALKMIRADPVKNPSAMKRFKRELELAQVVSHPNVCRVHDLGEADGVRFLSMEYLEGHTLQQLIRGVGGLSVRQTLQVADQICAALEAIHEKGIVHRDLKPSNIGIDFDGHAVIMDFGIARRPHDWDVTKPGMMVGSYAYLAPEQMRGEEIDHRVDIYALGLVLFEMLTGKRPPGDGDSRPLALRGEEGECPRPSELDPHVPRSLDAVVMRCLAWDPPDRPVSAADVQAALQEIRDEISLEQAVPARRQRQRRWSMAIIGAAVVLLLAIALLSVPSIRERLSDLVAGVDPSGVRVSVLPFDFQDAGVQGELLAALAADAVFAGLQSVPGLKVPPTRPADMAPGDRGDREQAGALDVDYVVRGMVIGDGDAVELVLTRGSDGSTWRRRIEEPFAPPFSTLSDATALLARQGLNLAGVGTSTAVAELRTHSLDAYLNYLEAWRAHGGWSFAGDLERAEELYLAALDIDEGFGAALAAQAMVTARRRLGGEVDAPEVVERLLADRALELDPELPEAWMAQATVAINEADWDAATADLERLSELAPGNDVALSLAHTLYREKQRYGDARRMMERALETRPAYWRHHYLLGNLLAQHSSDSEEAGEQLRLAGELEPEWSQDVGLILTRGYHHLIRGELAEAQGYFDRVNEMRAGLGYESGLVRYYLGDYESARDVWAAVLEIPPFDSRVATGLADAYRQLGQLEAARVHYIRALEGYDLELVKTPENPEARADRLLALAGLGRCDEALREMRAILELDTEAPEYAYYGAKVAGICGRTKEATELVLGSLRGANVVGIKYDPDFEFARRDEQVRRSLELLGHRLP